MTGRGIGLFIAKRLVVLALLLVFVSFAVFSLLHLAPGNAVDILLGIAPRTPATVRALRHEYHLDEPFLTQYWLWAKPALHFDFGRSVQTTLPVAAEIKTRFPTSLFLGLYAFILTMVFGIGLGLTAAFRRRTVADRGIVGGAIIGLSTPAFVSGIGLLYLFAVVLGWFPVYGRGSGFFNEVWHLTLPAVALALVASAYILRHTRASMINVLDQDYITFARARGLSARRVLFAYALRNGLMPVATISALTLPFLITGAVLVEVTFNIPGIGQLLVQSALAKDLPMIQGVSLVVAVLIMVANLAADIAYVVIDPRVRLGKRS